jgi:hypothetical protein
MGDQYPTPLRVALDGVVAGMTGALALSVLVTAGRKALAAQDKVVTTDDDTGITAGEALAEGPDLPPNMNQVTATFVQKVATGIFGTSLTSRQQYVAGTIWHLTYGGFWGMGYALLQSSVRVPKLVLGSVYGLAVWAMGFAWLVPKMKLILSPSQQHIRTRVITMSVHAVYGMIVALTCHMLQDRD